MTYTALGALDRGDRGSWTAATCVQQRQEITEQPGRHNNALVLLGQVTSARPQHDSERHSAVK